MLAYDQPITRSKPDAGPKPARPSAGLSVLQLVQLLWRRKNARPAAAFVEGRAAPDALNRRIVVKKTDRTFIVDIDVWSEDPAKAAMLANAISSAYLIETK